MIFLSVVITGASEQVVESTDEAMCCLDSGAAGRHVGSTNMNEHSSRSHAIFSVYIGKFLLLKSKDDVLSILVKYENVTYLYCVFLQSNTQLILGRKNRKTILLQLVG